MERKKVPTAKKMRRIKGAATKRTTNETEDRQSSCGMGTQRVRNLI